MAEPKVSPPRSWGRSVVQTACPLDCPDTCSLAVTVERGRVVKIDGSDRGAVDRRLHLRQGPPLRSTRVPRRADSASGRAHGPQGPGEFARVTWDEALDLIAERMREARDRFGAESVLPYHYGGSNGVLTNDFEDARFFRRFGASRLARTLCAAPTGAAATAMYGKMAGVAYDDYEDARLIIVWGCNPSASGIHLVSHIKQAQKDGAKLVVIDPRRTPLARRPICIWPSRPGTDLPVALALIRELFAQRPGRSGVPRGARDRRRRAARSAAEPWTIERAAARSRRRAARICATLAEWYGTISPAVIRCGWGQERNRNGGSRDDGDPGAAGRRRQVRRARRRLHDEQLRRLGHPGRALIDVPAAGVAARQHEPPRPRAARLSRIRRSRCCSSTTAIPLATVPDQNRVRAGTRCARTCSPSSTNR